MSEPTILKHGRKLEDDVLYFICRICVCEFKAEKSNCGLSTVDFWEHSESFFTNCHECNSFVDGMSYEAYKANTGW